MSAWKDITTYSKDDKERKPTTFRIGGGQLKIIVSCGHIDYRPKWIMDCHALGIDTKLLDDCESLKSAQGKAIIIAGNKLGEMKKELAVIEFEHCRDMSE